MSVCHFWNLFCCRHNLVIGPFNITDVCVLVCHHNNTKTAEQISTKLGWRMGLGPEWSPVAFGADQRFFFFKGNFSAKNFMDLDEKQSFLGCWHLSVNKNLIKSQIL